MSNPVGTPPTPNPAATIAERAKLIVERASSDTENEALRLKDAPEKERPQKPFFAKAERLPEKVENREYPQTIQGEVAAAQGREAVIVTEAGTVRVSIPPDVKLYEGQVVEIKLPPQSTVGAQVEILPQPPKSTSTEIPLPPVEKITTTKEFPPVKNTDVLLATEKPIEQYKISPESFAIPLKFYSPQKFLNLVNQLTQKLPLTNNVSLPETILPKIEPLINKTVLDIAPKLKTAISNTPIFTADDNILTQARVSQTSTQQPHAAQKVFQSIYNVPEMETPNLAKGKTQNIFPSPPEQIPLKVFQKIDILQVMPLGAPISEVENLVAQSLKENAPKKSNTISKPPQDMALATVIGTTANKQTIMTAPPAPNATEKTPRIFYVQTEKFIPQSAQVLVNITDLPLGLLPTLPQQVAELPPVLQSSIKPSAAAMRSDATLPLAAPMFQPAFAPVWPAMDDALNSLAQQAPSAAQAIQNTLPSASPRMASTALFFVAALKLGNIEQWLGDKNLDAIKQLGKKGLVERLAGDFTRIAGQFNEANAQGWKTLTLPMMHQGELSNIQLHIRQDDQNDSKQENEDEIDGPEKTRFVLDLTLSQMGQMQIDGYLTPITLDVILRNQTRLPEDDRRNLMKIFANTLEMTNLKGSLLFQNRPEDWVRIYEQQKRY